MSKTKVQNEERAQGVAETRPSSAAPSPGGPQRERATFASPGDAGVSGPLGPIGRELEEVLNATSHEIYCGCPDCIPADPHAEDECYECGEICSDGWDFCPDDCDSCPGETDLALEQFTFTIQPEDLSCGDYQDCWNPDTYMAFWEDGEDPSLIVADTQSDARWYVHHCEAQTRAASRQYYTWFCARIGVTDPCDNEFMRSISS